MTLPTNGHRIVSVLAGVLLAGTALAVPAVADTDPAGPASSTVQTGQTAQAEQTEQAQAAAVYRGRVTPAIGVSIRKTPNRNYKAIGAIPHGAVIDIQCKVNGEVVDGNPRWYLLKGGGWVAARWIENVNGIPPWC
ncbi:SH3 domain-containing protein [Streptomyces sp. SID3212]|uniref:SH3 domain-containing protein n=1 Tax=Streptomyces sp. SID3212 TaxID=2690259 RepID=UPI0013694780|nr:SH3 domain-containing protein [Streptomyces sp. SID3212]MYV51236.1 SH3 domain-containing protein [Streptomyces sp. SID3212]